MKIIYANTKESIELSCPSWLNFIMKLIWRHLKVKTVKINNGSKIKLVCFDEVADLPKSTRLKKVMKILDDIEDRRNY